MSIFEKQKNKKNIAVIGVGKLGERHLQSILELAADYHIYAVEPDKQRIATIVDEFPDVRFMTAVNDLPDEMETVVIATNSDVRRHVFDQLVSHSEVRKILFEKVLFQKVEDYRFVQEQIEQLGIKVWVNCARREWDSYKRLKRELVGCKELRLNVSGGNWGLGCNAIHILDLVEFLTEEKIEKLDISKLEDRIVESKRPGFYEFYGSITGSTYPCKSFEITCMDSDLPFCIEITTENSRYLIDESKNIMFISDKSSDWKWKEYEFQQVYQSQMTGRIVESITEAATCNLTPYDESMLLHLKFIEPLIIFFKRNGIEGDICPIT